MAVVLKGSQDFLFAAYIPDWVLEEGATWKHQWTQTNKALKQAKGPGKDK